MHEGYLQLRIIEYILGDNYDKILLFKSSLERA